MTHTRPDFKEVSVMFFDQKTVVPCQIAHDVIESADDFHRLKVREAGFQSHRIEQKLKHILFKPAIVMSDLRTFSGFIIDDNRVTLAICVDAVDASTKCEALAVFS